MSGIFWQKHYFPTSCVQFVSYFASPETLENEIWNGCWLQILSAWKHILGLLPHTEFKSILKFHNFSFGWVREWSIGLYCSTPYSLCRHGVVTVFQISDMSCNLQNCHNVASAWLWNHWLMLLKTVSWHLQTPCCASFPTWTKYVPLVVISLSWYIDEFANKR